MEELEKQIDIMLESINKVEDRQLKLELSVNLMAIGEAVEAVYMALIDIKKEPVTAAQVQ